MTLPTRAGAAIQPLPDGQPRVLRIRSAQITPLIGDSEVSIPLTSETIPLLATSARWAAPILALWRLLQPETPGASILIHSDIPQNAGQSSSTALLAAVALAIHNIEHKPSPSPLAIAQAVAAAEAVVIHGTPRAAPSNSHMIAALTCLHPRLVPAAILRYSAQPHRLVGPIRLPKSARVLALDTGVRHTRIGASGHSDSDSEPVDEFRHCLP